MARDKMFVGKVPSNIYIFYSMFQPMYQDLIDNVPNLQLIKGAPTMDQVDKIAMESGFSLVFIDDMGPQALDSPVVEKLFTQIGHHAHVSTFVILHNLYQRGSRSRNVQLNAGYIHITKSPRDKRQMLLLGSSIFPKNRTAILDSYTDMQRGPNKYNCLIIDLTDSVDSKYTLRTGVLPNDNCELIAYVVN